MEKSPRSKAALDVVRTLTGTELLLRWAIGGTKEESPYAAFAMPAGESIAAYDRLMFTSRADHRCASRFSSGWRMGIGGGDRILPRPDLASGFGVLRRRSSCRRDRTARTDGRQCSGPVLFVVDTINARPGGSGQVWIDDVKYGR